MHATFLLVASLLVGHGVLAVKMSDWKTCDQSGFCRRGRALSARAKAAGPATWISPYSIDAASASVSPDQSILSAAVKSSLYPAIKFSLEVRLHDDGVIRVRMDEVDGLRKRYDEAAGWALIKEPTISKDITWKIYKNEAKAFYREDVEVNVKFAPLKITMLRGGKEQVVLNGQGLLHMEHFRNKVEQPAAVEGSEAQQSMQVDTTTHWFEGDKEDALWEESFQSWEDTKPKGKLDLR